MTKNNTLNVKLSNSQANKLKSGTKYVTEVTLNLSSNVAGDSNDETNFPYRLLLIEAAVCRCSHKNVFWKYAANLQESTHGEVWFQ